MALSSSSRQVLGAKNTSMVFGGDCEASLGWLKWAVLNVVLPLVLVAIPV